MMPDVADPNSAELGTQLPMLVIADATVQVNV